MRKKWLIPIFIFILIFLICTAFAMAVYIRYPVRHLDTIRENAGEFEPTFILAVIMTESSFNEQARSHRGEQGLMQLMPQTAEDIAGRMGMTDFQPEDVWQPEINIAMGCFYLNRLHTLFGCPELALAAYNGGQGNVREWLSNPEYSRDGKSLNHIPFPETRNYLERVKSNQRIYEIILKVTGRS